MNATIRAIRCKRLRNLGNYENVTFEAEAEVWGEQSPDRLEAIAVHLAHICDSWIAQYIRELKAVGDM